MKSIESYEFYNSRLKIVSSMYRGKSDICNKDQSILSKTQGNYRSLL